MAQDPLHPGASAVVRAVQVGAAEPEFAQSRLHFRNTHKELPQQAGSMILHHDDDGSLIDGQVDITKPIPLFAECIEEAIRSPDPCPMPGQEMTQSTHYLARRIG